MTDLELAALLPAIAKDANKYTRGSLMVLAGSERFPGAAVLAALAAARTGAGYVSLAVPAPVVPVAQGHLLSVPVIGAPHQQGAFAADAWMTIKTQVNHIDAVVLGPGLTVTDASCGFVKAVIQDAAASLGVPVLVDADGLNCLAALFAGGAVGVGTAGESDASASDVGASGAVAANNAGAAGAAAITTAANAGTPTYRNLILTPHAGELRRLLDATGAADLTQLAQMLGCVVVAKGPETRVLSSTRQERSSMGTAALARAGTGDVLCGIIGGLLAQGVAPFDAALVGVEIHSRAGIIAQRELGLRSVCAEDVVGAIPRVLRGLDEL